MRTAAITDAVSTIAVASPNSHKGWIMIQNPSTSTDPVFLKFDGSATTLTATNGMALAPGETISIASNQDTPGIVGPIQAICAATKTATIRIQEVNFQAAS
jgi:hypothetical protein